MRGIFITIEGIEGSGKSTVAERIHEMAVGAGIEAVLTREPGGTEISEKIRTLLLDPQNRSLSPLAELFLYLASRAQLVDEVIEPKLSSGVMVICDRFMDASVAYQGFARHLGEELIEELNKLAVRDAEPDVTFLLDLPVDAGFERGPISRDARGIASMDRLEQEERSFHEDVRRGYIRLAERHSERVFVIDATRPLGEVIDSVISILEHKFGLDLKKK